jgi:hypothetical protein
MIYFTTFIFTLFLSHIARATPACGNIVSPEELNNPTHADAQIAQHALPIIANNVTWSNEFDNPNGDTSKVECSHYARSYKHFRDFPSFPYIGGASFVKFDKNCGKCWNLTNLRNNKSIFITPYRPLGHPLQDRAAGLQ